MERNSIIPQYKRATTRFITAPKLDKAQKLLNKIFPADNIKNYTTQNFHQAKKMLHSAQTSYRARTSYKLKNPYRKQVVEEPRLSL